MSDDCVTTETDWRKVEFADRDFYVALDGFGLLVCHDPMFPHCRVRLTQDMIMWLSTHGLRMLDEVPTEPGAHHG